MGNLVGKYAEWEVNEEESKDGEDVVEGIVCEGSVERVSVIMQTYIQASNQNIQPVVEVATPTETVTPKSGDKRKRSSSVEPNAANNEDGSATKKPRSPGTRGISFVEYNCVTHFVFSITPLLCAH